MQACDNACEPESRRACRAHRSDCAARPARHSSLLVQGLDFHAHASHELHVSLRAPKASRREVWALLLRVVDIMERILEDFPGIVPNAEVAQQNKARPDEENASASSLPSTGAHA